ncbi:MAG TPA: hypothetical protein VGL71_00615, partial [Urbifossiella sp.]
FHAEMTKKFDLARGFRFTVQFWQTVGGVAFLTSILFVPLAVGVAILGLLCLIVGIYPAASLIQMAAQHLLVQLYREYLDRGGEPLREYRKYDDDYDDEYDDEEYRE